MQAEAGCLSARGLGGARQADRAQALQDGGGAPALPMSGQQLAAGRVDVVQGCATKIG